MKKPPGPGGLSPGAVEPLGLTLKEAAKSVEVTPQALNSLTNGKAEFPQKCPIRLSKAFSSSPDVWLGMQMEYDLAQAEKHAGKIKVKRIIAERRV